MAYYDDIYEQYGQYVEGRDPEKDARDLQQAAERAHMLREDPEMTAQGDGFVDREGKFTLDPVIETSIRQAEMKAQMTTNNVPVCLYPEDVDVAIRFPGIDPMNRTSIIDMKFAQREAVIRATLETCVPEVKAYGQGLLDLIKNPILRDSHGNAKTNSHLVATWNEMWHSSMTHQRCTRGSKLCSTPEGRRILHQQAKALESCEAVENYDKMIQGIEYATGVRTGPVPEEIVTFYRDELELPLDLDKVAQATVSLPDPSVKEVWVRFQDLEHKLLHQVQAHPKNWTTKGLDLEDLAENMLDLETIDQAIPPYARATAARVLDPLFSKMEDATGSFINRGDLIIVDGKTVREKMFEDYAATGRDPAEFDNFYQDNYRTMASEYVSAALMAGKRVESFIPDKDGRIPAEPTQLIKTGYEPSPLKKVTLNAWERYFSKRGFFKEKTAKAAEYQRFVDARERVQATNLAAQFDMDTGVSPSTKAQFFSGWMAENGPLPTSVPGRYSVTRSALSTFATCALAARGHSIEEIHDPTNLAAEKDAVGREVIEHLQAGDQKWAGEILFHGQRALLADLDRLTTGMDLTKESVVLSTANRALFHAATTLFDASQEDSHCKVEMQAAAERFAPGHGREVFDTVSNGVGSSVAYFDYARKSLVGRTQLAGGLAPTNAAGNHLSDIVKYQVTSQLYGEMRAADPTLPMSKCFDLGTMGSFYGYAGAIANKAINPDPTYNTMIKRVETDPAFRVAVGKEALSGRFQQRMDIRADIGKMDFHFGLRALSKDELKQDAHVERIQTADQKNAAKAAQKPQGPTPRSR